MLSFREAWKIEYLQDSWVGKTSSYWLSEYCYAQVKKLDQVLPSLRLHINVTPRENLYEVTKMMRDNIIFSWKLYSPHKN